MIGKIPEDAEQTSYQTSTVKPITLLDSKLTNALGIIRNPKNYVFKLKMVVTVMVQRAKHSFGDI